VRVHVIGLTGGIASGKSTVSAILVENGAALLDADLLGHRTYQPGGPAYAVVVERFGRDILSDDRTIDRRALGAKVFGDADALKRLTDVVWPAIKSLATDELRTLERAGVEVVVLEAAVLIEAEWQDLADEVWVVTVPRRVAKQRLMERNGLSAVAADQRIDSQLTDAERRKYADRLIDNSGSVDDARAQVEKEWEALYGRLVPTG
jgi:dephospho-CoA kinase